MLSIYSFDVEKQKDLGFTPILDILEEVIQPLFVPRRILYHVTISAEKLIPFLLLGSHFWLCGRMNSFFSKGSGNAQIV